MKIKIVYKWYRWPCPFGAETDGLYERHYTSRNGNAPDTPWWEMPTRVAHWLSELPKKRTWLGTKIPAVMFAFRTERERGFSMVAEGGRLRIGKKPPIIWFARKSDILLMKITWGGNV